MGVFYSADDDNDNNGIYDLDRHLKTCLPFIAPPLSVKYIS